MDFTRRNNPYKKYPDGGNVYDFLFEDDEEEVQTEVTAPAENEIETETIRQEPVDDGGYEMAMQIALEDSRRISKWKQQYTGREDISLSPDQTYSGEALASNDKAKFAFEYYQQKGLQPHQAAGIVGNLMHESGLDPNSRQHNGGPGRGIAQWSQGDRWQSVLSYAKKTGKNPYNLTTQLDFILEEPGEGQKALSALQSARNVEEATANFMKTYERPGIPAINKRVGYAKGLLK